MTIERARPAVLVRVLQGGQPVHVPVLDELLLGLTFDDEERKADKCEITLLDLDQAVLNSDLTLAGQQFVVSWGYEGNLTPPRVVKLKKVKAESDRVILECYARALDLDRVKRSRSWTDVKRSDVVRTIAEEWGYTPNAIDIGDTEEVYPSINQSGETDAHLIARLARREGWVWYADERGFGFHERRMDATPAARYVWRRGAEGWIMRWALEDDSIRRMGTVRTRGIDLFTKTEVQGLATNETVDRDVLGEAHETPAVELPEPGTSTAEAVNQAVVGQVFDFTADDLEGADALDLAAVAPPDEAERLVGLASGVDVPVSATRSTEGLRREARSRFREADRRRLKMTMEMVGDPVLRSRQVIEVDGLGPNYSGLFYVRHVRHMLGGGGYKLEAKVTGDGLQRLVKGAKPKGGRRNNKSAPATGTDKAKATEAPPPPLESFTDAELEAELAEARRAGSFDVWGDPISSRGDARVALDAEIAALGLPQESPPAQVNEDLARGLSESDPSRRAAALSKSRDATRAGADRAAAQNPGADMNRAVRDEVQSQRSRPRDERIHASDPEAKRG